MKTFNHQDIKYEIASPCDQDWASMTGDDKCRFCDLCEKNVYNLSSMNNLEIEELLASDKNVCTRIYKRTDGTILTEDCPIGLKQVRNHLKQKQFIAASLCLLAILFSSFTQAGEKGRLMGKMIARPLIEKVEEPEIIETVGPEENWDYKNKIEVIEDQEEHIMGSIAPIQQR